MKEPKERTDRQLLNLVGTGPGAFEILYVRYYDIVYRHVRSILHETDLAASITAETFARLFQHCMLLAPTHKPLKQWLVTVAGNLARNELRRESRVVVLNERQIPFDESDTSLQDFIGAHAAEIRDAVCSLPSLERSCLRMRYVNDMTTTDIAGTLHCSKRQVTVALDDAYKALRKRLACLSPGQR
jgi:RNA polymerase sigma factor (sigma-70 family)